MRLQSVPLTKHQHHGPPNLPASKLHRPLLRRFNSYLMRVVARAMINSTE